MWLEGQTGEMLKNRHNKRKYLSKNYYFAIFKSFLVSILD